MNPTTLQATLEALSGGSQVLTTKQVATVVNMNHKVISRMRSEGRFPIRHKKIGEKKIVYPIAFVVDYLMSDEPEVSAPKKAPIKVEPEKRRATNKAVFPDLSRKVLLRGLVSFLENQRGNIEESLLYLTKKMRHDELQDDLKKKPETEFSKNWIKA